MTMITNRTGAALAVGALALLLGGVANAQPMDGKCVAGKQKCSAAQMISQFGCLSKDAKTPDMGSPTFPILSACIQKAQTKYDGLPLDATKGCFAKLDAKAATSPCLTGGGTPPAADSDA